MNLLTVHDIGNLTLEYRFNETIRIADALQEMSVKFAMPCGGQGFQRN
ncbi:MAG: hypothetical protein N2Z65_06490 [Clostridiales bacterium]|nr:hypothetical protein [Clostridiales bacterium]